MGSLLHIETGVGSMLIIFCAWVAHCMLVSYTNAGTRVVGLVRCLDVVRHEVISTSSGFILIVRRCQTKSHGLAWQPLGYRAGVALPETSALCPTHY